MKNYKFTKQVNPESTEGLMRAAYQDHHARFSPKLQEFKIATMELTTPAHLKNKLSRNRTIEQHRKNSLEYINGSVESFRTYLEEYTSLMLVQFLEDTGKIKAAIEMNDAIKKAIVTTKPIIPIDAIAEIPDIEKPKKQKKKPLKTSKKYNDAMDKKFNIKKKKESKK
jgi:hypothetical protein